MFRNAAELKIYECVGRKPISLATVSVDEFCVDLEGENEAVSLANASHSSSSRLVHVYCDKRGGLFTGCHIDFGPRS